MFSGASNFAADVDKTFLFIISISLFFLIGITLTMIYFAVRYSRKRHPKAVQIKDNILLEVIWTVVPIILVLFMFYYGYEAFLPQRQIPDDAMPVKVISKMWNWTFDYGNGKTNPDTLVVPLNKPVRLDMISLDVNHSFYVPAFRIKEDVVPGMTTNMWFIAEKPGVYEILCAEFCGLRHSYMLGHVKVVPEEEYIAWLDSLKVNDTNKELHGLAIMKQNACVGCHSIDGSKLVGPSFKNLYKSEYVVLVNGEEHKIIADSSYIKDAIYNPDANIVKGYSKGLMKSYIGVINEVQMSEIIKYLESISDKK
jgi:cytochrome c oxidase subunit II